MERFYKKIKCGTMALLLALAAVLGSLSFASIDAKAEGEEIVDKGDGITWVDASVQLPQNYASIVGFKLTFKLLSDNTDYVSGYGGVTEDPNDPSYNMHYPTYMLVASKGAHDSTEFNENTFWCEEGENYEHYNTGYEDLADCEIVKIGVGSGYYVAGYLDNGKGYGSCQDMVAGDEATITYEGTEALFEQGDPIMTFYNYTADFEIESIEWITGTPVVTETVDWDTVEKETIADVETVENSADQNGSNYVNIIRPAEGDGPFPVILWVHGGGWTTSSRTDIILNETMEYFLAQGYAFVSAEYTLSDRDAELTEEEQAKVDACATEEEKEALIETYQIKNDTQGKQMIYDLKLAVRFLRAHAGEYNLDTRFIGAMGESAGAHLSLLMATTNGDEDYEGPDGEKYGGYADYSSDVQCAVAYSLPTDLTGESVAFLRSNEDIYPIIAELDDQTIYDDTFIMAYCLTGYSYLEDHLVSGTIGDMGAEYDDEAVEALEFMSPYCQVDSNSAPMYLIHGEADEAVMITHAYAMELMAKQFMASDDVLTAYYPEATHVDKKYFDVYSQYASSCDFTTEIAKEYGCFAAMADEDVDAQGAEETSAAASSGRVNAGLIAGIIAVVAAGGIGGGVYASRKKKKNGEK